MQIVTGRRGEPHVTSRQMQAVYRSFLGDFALLDIGEKLRAEAYSNDIVRVYDGVVSVQGIYAVIAYNQYDEVYIEPVSVGKKRIDTIVLHYTKDNALDVEDMQLDVVQGEEYTDNPIAPVVPEGGDAWEGTTDIQVPIYDVEVTNFGLTVIPHARMLTVIPTLDSIAERIPETVVTGVKGDSEVLYRDGDVNITKANIGLGNVDNTADTDKPISAATQTALNLKADLVYVNAVVASAYHAGGNLTVAELTSALLITENMGKVYNMSDSGVTTADFVEGAGKPIREGDDIGICNRGTEENPIYKFNLLSGFVDLSAYATTSAMNTALAGKVDKVDGKGLSTNDYTTTDKTKLAGISEGATQTIANPADTATETLSKVEIEGTVYDIPQGASGATELSELTDVNLSNVEDNDILQYDETANKWKNSNALRGAKTITGNPITVTDAAPVNAVNLSMDLEPIQAGSGTPSPDNIRPISGRSEVNVGRDLLDWNTPTDSNVDSLTYSFGTIELSDTRRYRNVEYLIPIKSTGIQHMSISFDVITSGSKGLVAILSNGTVLYQSAELTANTILNFEFNANTNNVSLLLFATRDNDGGKVAYSNITLNGQNLMKTYTIQIGQTVYGAHYDVTRGKMVVDRGYIASYNGETLPSTWISDRDVYASGTSPTTGAQVVYELATPYTIQLTPQQIKMLENTNTIYTDYEGDTITIEYQPNNAIGEAVRVVEESYDPEFAVRPVLKKKAFSGTTDTDGAVTLINASDIPSGHKIIPLQITDMTIDGNTGTYFVEYEPYNSGDSVKGYCYFYMSGSQMFPVGKAITGNFYYYDLEV